MAKTCITTANTKRQMHNVITDFRTIIELGNCGVPIMIPQDGYKNIETLLEPMGQCRCKTCAAMIGLTLSMMMAIAVSTMGFYGLHHAQVQQIDEFVCMMSARHAEGILSVTFGDDILVLVKENHDA